MDKDMELLKELAQGAESSEIDEFSAEYDRVRQLIDKGI